MKLFTRRAPFVLSILMVLQVYAQHPEAADAVLKNAFRLSASQDKNVFVIFHASWCIWCHKMDSSMNDNCCNNFFNDNYIIRHLTVKESENKKQFENPGADRLLARYGTPDDGLPVWLIFDKNGNLLADSHIRSAHDTPGVPGVNSGCPARKEEVEYFISVLKKTSGLTGPQLSIIEKRFRENDN
jgi:thiol-disulfide isomerase/thioredoxin